MIEATIAVLAILILILMSLRANREFSDYDRLPMQWSLDGSVNWTAPRPMALAFTPILSAFILITTAALTIFLKPKAGQGWIIVPTMIFMALTLIGAHAFHLWMIGKSLRRPG